MDGQAKATIDPEIGGLSPIDGNFHCNYFAAFQLLFSRKRCGGARISKGRATQKAGNSSGWPFFPYIAMTMLSDSAGSS